MTNKLSDTRERISPADIALADKYYKFIIKSDGCRTYAFDITSDTSHRAKK